jgi:L-alanine-DL-glutamate epimerase-like enolase superfamily enzyme
VEIRAHSLELPLAQTFAIARSSRDTTDVVWAELDHDGVVGHGEGAPVDYWGETVEGMVAFLRDDAPALVGDDPWALEAIGARVAASDAPQGAKQALDGALHDWIGHRLGQPVWRLLGLERVAPPTSFTIGIDTVEGTRDRAHRARGFRVLKVKVGGPDDLERLRVVREEAGVPVRIDGNEGWTLETARALVPELVELGVELVEQPFPADDLDAFRALREIEPRPPVVVDEGCRDLATVAPVAGYADGINVKLAKAGGLREGLRMVHAARALGLGVMLGCMVESQLGIAAAAQMASLVDWVDLDGHLLLGESPWTGLGLEDGRVVPSEAPGLGVIPAW